MTDSLRLTARFPVSPERVAFAWLDASEHEAMTGAPATSEPHAGGGFSAWGDYITGTHLEIGPGRIVQAWRTTEFPAGAPDSRLEILLTEVEGGCEVTLVHTAIPAGQGPSYQQGWTDYYFEPMATHFGAGEGR